MSLQDLAALLPAGERADFDAKVAAGRDGRGELPQSFWESYVAMANSEGGRVPLGVADAPGALASVRASERFLGMLRSRTCDEVWAECARQARTAQVQSLASAMAPLVSETLRAAPWTLVPRRRVGA